MSIDLELRFEWDGRKALSNEHKHKVSFAEAKTAFGDRRSVTIADPVHSFNEERYILIGRTTQGRLVVVAHTERNNNIRIISARIASAKERKHYES